MQNEQSGAKISAIDNECAIPTDGVDLLHSLKDRIAEIEDQMKHFSVENKKIQAQVEAKGTRSTRMIDQEVRKLSPTYQKPLSIMEHISTDNGAPKLTISIPATTTTAIYLSASTIVQPTSISPATCTTTSSSTKSFRLHTPTQPPSRLDPCLELNNETSSSYGMTYKSSTRTPRKTWDSGNLHMYGGASTMPMNNFNNDSNNNNHGNDSAILHKRSDLLDGSREQFHLFSNVQEPHFVLDQNKKRPVSTPSYVHSPHSRNAVANQSLSAAEATNSGHRHHRESSPAGSTSLSFFSSPVSARTMNGVSATAQMTTYDSRRSLFDVNDEDDEKTITQTFVLKPSIMGALPDNSVKAVGYVIGDDSENAGKEALKSRFLASTLKRKMEQENKRVKIEQESMQRREELARKQEEAEQRRKEQELRRAKVREAYDKRKAEEEQVEFNRRNNISNKSQNQLICYSSSTSNVPLAVQQQQQSPIGGVARAAARANRVRSQPAARQRLSRPASQYMGEGVGRQHKISTGSVGRLTHGHGSADNLDLMDGKSQSSDGASVSGSGCSVEPTTKVYVKATPKSNRNLITNALRDRVLVGAANADKKIKVLEELARSDGKHFLILFRDQKCQFRGVYSWDQVSDNVHKVCGVGPKICHESLMKILFKYDSGGKQFEQVPARHLSATIDAFTINEDYWQEKRNVYQKSLTMVK
uniref:CKK domain-containing protein n=1 Tax=Romanomermis culicivorax TaxID=13658 RepID=A0A915IMI5_ROMCU